MHPHQIVNIDAAASSGLDCLVIKEPGHETQTIDRGDRRLDPPDASPEPGAGRRRAGPEEGRLSTAGLVRRAARIVAGPFRRIAPGGIGKADAASAILDLPADRSVG